MKTIGNSYHLFCLGKMFFFLNFNFMPYKKGNVKINGLKRKTKS